MAVQCETSHKRSTENVTIEDSTEVCNKSWLNNCSPQFLLLITMLGAAILASLLTLVVLLTKYPPVATITENDFKSNTSNLSADPELLAVTTIENNIENVANILNESKASDKLNIISRSQWLAAPPVEPGAVLETPVPYVIVHHTATENCSDVGTCTFQVRYIQTFHIDSRGWWDIGYNFLVGGDGYVYEGRGWKTQGTHSYGYNAKSLGIAIIGTFNQIKPPDKQINAAKFLIQYGLEKGYISENYKLLAARQLMTTSSPGLMLYEDVKTWPHWSENL